MVRGIEKQRVKGVAGTLIIFDSTVLHQSIRNLTVNDTHQLSRYVYVTR
jgi:hypothetical protein